MATITDPNGHLTSNSYDRQGNLLSHTDALGRQTCYQYDSRSDVTAVSDPSGVSTTMQ